MHNTELRTRARTRARVGRSVLSTIEKSARPSASLRLHRNFEFSFWDDMSTFLLWTIQNSFTRARARARVRSSVLSALEKSARPSASLKGHRNFEFSFWNDMSTFLLWTIQNSFTRARARACKEFCIVRIRKVGASVGLLKGSQKL